MSVKKPSPEALQVGHNIRVIRHRRGLTGKDIWARAHIDPTSLSFMERGLREPSLGQMRRLALCLGVAPRRLLRGAFGARGEP